MRYILRIVTAALLLAFLPKLCGAATIDFDPAKMKIDLPTGRIEYDRFDKIAVGIGLDLPVQKVRVELNKNELKPEISWKITGRSVIGVVDPEQALGDIMTADRPEIYPDAIEARKAVRLGQEAVHVVDFVRRGNASFVELMVFPVTVDDNGTCHINRSITIYTGQEVVSADCLLPQQDTGASVTDLQDDPTSSPAVDYLIITSQSLRAPVDSLCCYKNSTGISTEVELIDDILGAYSGRDDAEKLRERLKDFGADGGRYVLLAGDETVIPVRYAYPYSTSTMPSMEYQQICDLYYADLTGEWDVDNDNVWGEKYVDDADINAELIVGRLPFNSVGEFERYLEKLIIYETNPGGGDTDYLEKSFFFSSDQMRDYGDGGQHRQVAQAYPANFKVDTANGLELSSGSDPNPYNQPAEMLESVLSSGYGIVNIIAHGTNDAFGVKTTNYNEWPKSYFLSYDFGGDHGDFNNLDTNCLISFYYSLACDNGGFDFDQPPLGLTSPNLVQSVLALKKSGAIGFVANSRWGWVSSSYLLHRTFFEHLFANPNRSAAQALYDTKQNYTVYRDQVFGLNYFGDPTVKIYTENPGLLLLSTSVQGSNLVVQVSTSSGPAEACDVIVSQAGTVVQEAITSPDGRATINYDFELNKPYKIAAVKAGYSIGYGSYTRTLITDIDDDDRPLPSAFSLSQNYPNPFNPSTTISFELAARSDVSLVVYNIMGQTVSVLVDEPMPAGQHSIRWHGRDDTGNPVASGVYLYRLQAEEFVDVKKMIMLR